MTKHESGRVGERLKYSIQIRSTHAVLILLLGILYILNTPRTEAQTSELGTQKKVIEFGWDEPDTAYLQQNIGKMEQRPFNGVVFHVRYNQLDGSPYPNKEGSFLADSWGNKSISAAELTRAAMELRNTRFNKFTDNFVRLNVSPGNVDWFDDFSAIKNNVRNLAELAHTRGVKGVFFDIEAYGFPLFNYSKQKYSRERTFADYSKQVELRGKEIVEELQRGFPGLTIFLTYGYSLPAHRANFEPNQLPEIADGLVAPFLDGLLSGAHPDTHFTEGYEISYRFKQRAQFDHGLLVTRKEVLPFVKNPTAYRKHFATAFGLWLDAPNENQSWDRINLQFNFFTPQEFGSSVKLALEKSDEYVWIYTQRSKWWNAPIDQLVPIEYENALKEAAITPWLENGQSLPSLANIAWLLQVLALLRFP